MHRLNMAWWHMGKIWRSAEGTRLSQGYHRHGYWWENKSSLCPQSFSDDSVNHSYHDHCISDKSVLLCMCWKSAHLKVNQNLPDTSSENLPVLTLLTCLPWAQRSAEINSTISTLVYSLSVVLTATQCEIKAASAASADWSCCESSLLLANQSYWLVSHRGGIWVDRRCAASPLPCSLSNLRKDQHAFESFLYSSGLQWNNQPSATASKRQFVFPHVPLPKSSDLANVQFHISHL